MKIFILLFAFLFLTFRADAQWQKQAVNSTASLRGLSVVDENIIWASGTGGTFLN